MIIIKIFIILFLNIFDYQDNKKFIKLISHSFFNFQVKIKLE